VKWFKRRREVDTVNNGVLASDYEAVVKNTYRYVLEEEVAADASMSLAHGYDDALFEFKSGEAEMARKLRKKLEKETLTRGLGLR
jgi:hypothetical protein